MLALVTDIRTGKPQAIHRTAIDANGNKIVVDGKDRMALRPDRQWLCAAHTRRRRHHIA